MLSTVQKLHPSHLLTATAIGIISGNILALSIRPDFFSDSIWLFFVCLMLVLSGFFLTRFTIIIAFLAGNILLLHRVSVDLIDQNRLQRFAKQRIIVSGTVCEDPDIESDKIKLRLSNLQVNHQNYRGTLFATVIYRKSHPPPRRSDQVIVAGIAKPGFGSFPLALTKGSIQQIIPGGIESSVVDVRDSFASSIQNYIPSPNSNLALGYLLGLKSALPKTLSETLQVVGLTHIIVASGANLSILVNFSKKLFGRLSRFAATTFSALLILTFTMVTGFTPSMARAAIVALLSLIAWHFGRRWQPLRLLIIVAAMTLFMNPMYLIDLGWLLSFSAFAGILICTPIFKLYFYGYQNLGVIRSSLLETASASILCLPILLYFFGSFSLISIIANILILPTISIVMALTFTTGITALLPLFPAVFAFLANLLIKYHLWVINLFGSQKSFLITVEKANPFIFFLYFPILLLLLYMHHQNHRVHHNNICSRTTALAL